MISEDRSTKSQAKVKSDLMFSSSAHVALDQRSGVEARKNFIICDSRQSFALRGFLICNYTRVLTTVVWPQCHTKPVPYLPFANWNVNDALKSFWHSIGYGKICLLYFPLGEKLLESVSHGCCLGIEEDSCCGGV